MIFQPTKRPFKLSKTNIRQEAWDVFEHDCFWPENFYEPQNFEDEVVHRFFDPPRAVHGSKI